MMAARKPADWKQDLPRLRGRVAFDAPLAPLSWFRVGGPAEMLFRPADADDLSALLAAVPDEVPVTMIGVGSNLLIRDGGVPGIVVRLAGAFAEIKVDGTMVTAGAAALDLTVAKHALEAGIAGLEFLSGVPGTIGGALRMNAGAFGSEMKDVVRSARVMDRKGAVRTLKAAELGFSYRHCQVPEGHVFLDTAMQGKSGDAGDIAARMEAIREAREASQPTRVRTGGSTFANPEGTKAWELIDKAGCRGLTIGGAQVSEKHCNFLLNTGEATAKDIERLGEEVRRRVKETSGIDLRWEIRRIGIEGETA